MMMPYLSPMPRCVEIFQCLSRVESVLLCMIACLYFVASSLPVVEPASLTRTRTDVAHSYPSDIR